MQAQRLTQMHIAHTQTKQRHKHTRANRDIDVGLNTDQNMDKNEEELCLIQFYSCFCFKQLMKDNQITCDNISQTTQL